MPQDSSVRLTQTVAKGGCAAKIAAQELRHILGQVRFPTPHPELLVDSKHFDDAAVYKVSEDLALVQTLDFFTPIVDTPKVFGAIAAANALSDVYAMGGKPKTAMGILAYPLASFEAAVPVDVLQGASDILRDANCNFVGGHSIDDDTLKFGLSVTGYVHPDKVWSNRGAAPGDHLVLTKALGTGTLTAALKRQKISETDMGDALQSMTQLNNVVDHLGEEDLTSIHAATDVTGFGLAGHALQMARASSAHLQIETANIPAFAKVKEFLAEGFLTKAHRTNAEYTAQECRFDLNAVEKLLVHDPQTSGGLLIAISSEKSEEIVRKLQAKFPWTRKIGEVKSDGSIGVSFAAH